MKKKIMKATFVVAAVAFTATGSLVAYDRYQQAVFDAANPLFNENLEALADPSGSSSSQNSESAPMGPAQKIVHEWKTRITGIDTYQAQIDFKDKYRIGPQAGILYRELINSYSTGDFLDEEHHNIPIREEFKKYIKTETKKFFTGKCVLAAGGQFQQCQSIYYTSLSEDERPNAGTYLTVESYNAQFR